MPVESGLNEQEIISKLMEDQKARALYLGDTGGGYDSAITMRAGTLCCKIVFLLVMRS